MPPGVSKPTVESLAVELDRLKRAIAFAFLCPKGVMARYGWSRRTYFRRRHDPQFPKPQRFPGNGWTLAQLEQAERAGQLPSPVAGR